MKRGTHYFLFLVCMVLITTVGHAQSLLEQGRILLKQQKYTEALQKFEAHVAANFEDPNGYFYVGVASMKVEKFKKATILINYGSLKFDVFNIINIE